MSYAVLLSQVIASQSLQINDAILREQELFQPNILRSRNLGVPTSPQYSEVQARECYPDMDIFIQPKSIVRPSQRAYLVSPTMEHTATRRVSCMMQSL